MARLFHMIKFEFGHTAMEDNQMAGNQGQPTPAITHNAAFFAKGYSLENTIADAMEQVKDYVTRMTAPGPRDTH